MRVAAIQLSSGADKVDNLTTAAGLVARSVGEGAELVVLPEMTNVLGSGATLRDGAEPWDGPYQAWAAEQARSHGVWLLAGSFVESIGPNPGSHPGSSSGSGGSGSVGRSNTSVLLTPSGGVAAAYRKVHLFDCAVPGAEFRESDVTDPGDELIVAPLGDGGVVVGMSICYDLRFPELYRILALRGANLLAVPAAFTARTGPPHWEVLLRARAIENRCFVVAAGQVGSTDPGQAWHGHSMIIDPWGTVLAEVAEPRTGIAVADLDLDRLAEVRSMLPSLASRRPSAYRWPET